MSAEVETSKEEEVKVHKARKPAWKRLLDNWPLGLKVLELLICAICMGCIYDPISSTDFGSKVGHHIGIMYTAFTGYMLINCVLLLGRSLGDRMPYKTMAIFAIMGSIVFLVAGILLIVDMNIIIENIVHNKLHYIYASSAQKAPIQASITFAFLNVIVFAADAVLTFTLQHDF